MIKKVALVSLLVLGSVAAQAFQTALVRDENGQLELNPADPNVNQTLRAMDQQYELETGLKANTLGGKFQEGHAVIQDLNLTPDEASKLQNTDLSGGCYRDSCAVYIYVDKSEQRMAVYVEGQLINGPELWKVSTGRPGFTTPNFDKHPDGRIYQVHTSSKYPGYNNMPYAIFIRGGYAMHGAPGSEDAHLGTVASHGCIRVRTSNVERLNEIVRQYGVRNTWVTVVN